MHRKGTILIPSGPAHDPHRKHLHVVCTDTDAQGKNLIVSICSVPQPPVPYDTTCVFEAHEHRWLTHQSYVAYRYAKIEEAAKLQNGLNQGVFVQEVDMNGQSFLKVVNRMCQSPQTPRLIKRYLNCP